MKNILDQLTNLEESKISLSFIFYIFILVLSLFQGIKLPIINAALYNLSTPFLSIFLLLINYDILKKIWIEEKQLIRVWTALFIWMFISAFFSPVPETLKYSVKYSQYYFLFVAMLCYVKYKDLILRTYLLIYRFMSIIALSGIIDWIWHKQLQLFFMFFRSEASLDVYPRVSGFMMCPNQFAVLLDVAIIISFILRKYSKIGKKEFFINTIFMLTSISLSGSRNAWLSLAFGFLLAWSFKVVNIRKLLLIGMVWTLIMLSFPVPAIRLGIKNCHFIPLSNIIITFRPDSFLARQLISQKKTASQHLPSLVGGHTEKLQRWKMAIELWSEHPVTGIGWRGFSFIFEKKYKIPFQNIDNLALTILSELGIGGMILSLFLFYFLIRGTKWSLPLISIPLLLFLFSQILDCFIHDITFMSIYFFFLACLRCFKNEKHN